MINLMQNCGALCGHGAWLQPRSPHGAAPLGRASVPQGWRWPPTLQRGPTRCPWSSWRKSPSRSSLGRGLAALSWRWPHFPVLGVVLVTEWVLLVSLIGVNLFTYSLLLRWSDGVSWQGKTDQRHLPGQYDVQQVTSTKMRSPLCENKILGT